MPSRIVQGCLSGADTCAGNVCGIGTHPYLEPWRDQTFMPAFCAMLLGRYVADVLLCTTGCCMRCV